MFDSLRSAGLAASLLMLTTVAPLATGQERRPSGREPSRNTPEVLAAFRDVVATPRQSTVRVLGDGTQKVFGTVVGSDGWILTKASELKGNLTVHLASGKELEAKLVGVHEPFDLAMLKVETRGLTPVAWRDSKETPVGNWVAAVGTSESPVAVGVVSVAVRKGGLRAAPDPSGGYLGVQLEPADGGIKVAEVSPGSPAEKAGLKVNDIITALEGKAISDVDALIAQVQRRKPGETVTLRVHRKGEEMDHKAVLARRPANLTRGFDQNAMGSELSRRRDGFPVFLQHDTVLKPSECGGPLVDLDGKAIGVNIARTGRTDSYAIPSEAIVPILHELMSGSLAPSATSAAPTSLKERVAEAQAQVKRLEAEAAAVQKKLDDARAALARVEAELKAETAKQK